MYQTLTRIIPRRKFKAFSPTKKNNLKTRPMNSHRVSGRYTDRVRETLTTRVSKYICAVALTVFLLAGIISFILWISLRPHRPRFYIDDFTVSSMGRTNGFENAHIKFKVNLRNPNNRIGVYYDLMEGECYYKGKRVGFTPLLDPFYQKPDNTTVVSGVMGGPSLTADANSWTEFTSDRRVGIVKFRLRIKSIIRFSYATLDMNRHVMRADCDVDLGPDGKMLGRVVGRRCPVYFT